MKVVITAATAKEWMPAFAGMNKSFSEKSSRLKVQFCQTGVGILASSVALTKLVIEDKPNLIIQMGIAGSFHKNIPLGKVVVVDEEILGDTGVEEDGVWKDIFDLKLEKSSNHPYEKRALPNPWLQKFNLLKLPELKAITVNEINTNQKRINQLKKKYAPDLESMEGAALHYIGREMGIPFIQIRAISNVVGERDKSKWQMKASIDHLNKTVLQYIDALYKIK